jgi:hypothetical protein
MDVHHSRIQNSRKNPDATETCATLSPRKRPRALQQALLGHGHRAPGAHDDVIEQADVNDFERGFEAAGDELIRLRGLGAKLEGDCARYVPQIVLCPMLVSAFGGGRFSSERPHNNDLRPGPRWGHQMEWMVV